MRKIIPVIIIFVLSFAIYLNSLSSGFFLDDKPIIQDNSLVHSLNNIPKIFVSNYWANTAFEKGVLLYRPLVIGSFTIDYSIWGNDPFGFHLTNIIINALNSVLLYVLLSYLFGSSLNSYYLILIALLFSCHPVHTEAVNMIVGRTELMACFFSLITLTLYLKNNYTVSFMTFFLALLSKESATTVPVILFMYEFMFKKKYEKIHYVIFFIVFILYLFIRINVLGGFVAGHQTGILANQNLLTRIFTIFLGLGYYLKLLIVPYPLSPDYTDIPLGKSLFQAEVLLSVIVIVLLVAVALKFYKTKKTMVFSMLWFFVTILPVSNVISIGALLGERFMYIPSVGLSLLFTQKMTKPVLVILIILLIVFGAVTFNRNFEWRDNFSLWSAVLKHRPENVRAHYNIAEHYENKGEYDKAVYHYQKSIKFYPEHNWNPDSKSVAVVNSKITDIGNLYYSLCLKAYRAKRYEEALEYCRKVITTKQDLAEAYVLMGNCYFQLGDVSKALENYKKALQIAPDMYEAKENYNRIK